MKMKLIIILSLFFSLAAIAQQPEYPDSGFTNKAEAKNLTINGLKEGKWLEYIIEYQAHFEAPPGWDTTFYNLLVYKNGIRYGIARKYWYGFIGDPDLCGVKHYIQDNKTRIEKEYWPDGKLWTEGPYINGKENGVIKKYSMGPGYLEYECPYINGVKNGIEKHYYKDHDNGDYWLWTETPYTNGVKNGDYKEYYRNGKLETETIYKNGVAGTTLTYDENGIVH